MFCFLPTSESYSISKHLSEAKKLGIGFRDEERHIFISKNTYDDALVFSLKRMTHSWRRHTHLLLLFVYYHLVASLQGLYCKLSSQDDEWRGRKQEQFYALRYRDGDTDIEREREREREKRGWRQRRKSEEGQRKKRSVRRRSCRRRWHAWSSYLPPVPTRHTGCVSSTKCNNSSPRCPFFYAQFVCKLWG